MVAAANREQELVLRSVEGDRRAFQTLVETHLGALFRYACLNCATGRGAEEALAQGLEYAWKQVEKFPAGQSARAWLMRFVVEACRGAAPAARAPEAPIPATAFPKSCDSFAALLSDYLDGELTATDQSRLESHLEECRDCASCCEDLRVTLDTLHRHLKAEQDLPEEARRRLEAAIGRRG
jgi:DNA-directed RNA polymerase specialized sigma24 family protein